MGKEIFRKWYWKNNPQWKALTYELLKRIRHHTVGFVGKKATHRFLTIGKRDFLIGQLKKRFFEGNPYWDFFKSIEFMKLARKEDGDWKPIEKEDYKENWDQYRYGFNFIMDIDGEGETRGERIKDAKRKAEKIVNFYEDLNVPYSVVFSGNKGFHIKIPWKYKLDEDDEKATPLLSKYFEPDDYATIPGKLGEFVNERCFEDEKDVLDTMVWAERKDLIRTPYSLHPKSELVALPLSKVQFRKFSLDMADPEWVMENLDLKNRRLLLREGSLDKFIEEFRESSDIDEYEEEKQEERKKYTEKISEIVTRYQELPKKYKARCKKAIRRIDR